MEYNDCGNSSRKMSSTILLQEFTVSGYKIWKWRFCLVTDIVIHWRQEVMDVYRQSHRTGMGCHPKYLMETEGVDVVNSKESLLCLVEYTNVNKINRLSKAAHGLLIPPPESFLDILEEWGCTCLWDDMQLTGDTEWLGYAISENCLMVVTDGSFIRELLPDFCLACLVLECTQERGRLIVIFSQHSAAANAYRGELFGLMTIHLLLLSVHRISPALQGSVKI